MSRRAIGFRKGDSLLSVEVPEGAEVETRDGAIVAVSIGGRRVPVRAAADGADIHVWCEGAAYDFRADPPRVRGGRAADEAGLRAPMPGRVVRTLVAEGDRVSRGATLLILEAMKMEHAILAPRDGTVSRLPFRAGEQVDAGAILVDFTG